MSAAIRANAVEVVKVFHVWCRIEGCDYAGELKDTYQEANADRQAHLDEHRERATS